MILSASDEPPVTRVEGKDLDWLVVCDHASNRVPRALGDLGMPTPDLVEHIAWDIGAADIATRLARRLRAPLIMSGYSRLVVDCNRYPTAPDAVPEHSDGRPVPANQGLDVHARRARHAVFFQPYHRAIDAALRSAEIRGRTPVFLSIHSCAPSMNGIDRPWQIGVAWLRDDRVAAPLMAELRADPALNVGDNCPYSLDLGADFTTPQHAMVRGLPHLQIEFRQDLFRVAGAAERWADTLHAALVAVSDADRWRRREYHLTPADDIRGIERWL